MKRLTLVGGKGYPDFMSGTVEDEPEGAGPMPSKGFHAHKRLTLSQALGRRKKRFLSGAGLRYERLKQFFMLPACYLEITTRKDLKRPGLRTARDLLVLFFSYKTFPDHYGRYRLWECDRKEWKYYYGSNYHPHQKNRLRRSVQPSEYRVVFNDKYICDLLIKALGVRTPYTYGVISPDHDYRAQLQAWLFASAADKVIIKPLFGETGRDIVFAEKADQHIVIKSNAASSMPLEDYVLKEKAIVQDVLRQDSRMAAFSPSSVNTIRVVTMMTGRDDPIVVSAALRSGVGNAIIDNWSAGGVGVGIDCRKGRLKKYAYDKKSHAYEAHPTTGVVFDDHVVPEWDSLCSIATGIQKAFSFYRLLGFDLALDQSGEPVLLEINSAPDLTFSEQVSGPLFKCSDVLRAFGDDELLVNRHQKKLYSILSGGSGNSS